MAFLPIFRLAIFIATSIFAIIVLGLAADLTSLTEEGLGGFFTFAAMGIAVAALTLLTLPVMIGIDFVRRGAFTSMVLVELVWTFILWVLWLAAAALAAQEQQLIFGASSTCDFANTDLATGCNEISAIEAFGFLAWLTLMGYNITLFIFAIIGANRGHRSWFSTVGDGVSSPRDSNTNTAPTMSQSQIPMSTGGAYSSAAPSSMQYPPQQQHQGQPMAAQV